MASAWALAGGLVLLAIMAVTTANVAGFAADRVARPFGGSVSGLPGYEDFVRLAVSGAALMFLPWCQHRRGHVRVELFGALLPPALTRALDRLWLAALAGLALFLAWWMAQGLAETRADGALSPVLGWPQWPFYAPGIVSLVLWALVAGWQAATGEGAGEGAGDAGAELEGRGAEADA